MHCFKLTTVSSQSRCYELQFPNHAQKDCNKYTNMLKCWGFFHKVGFQSLSQCLNFSVCGYSVMIRVHLSQALTQLSFRLWEVFWAAIFWPRKSNPKLKGLWPTIQWMCPVKSSVNTLLEQNEDIRHVAQRGKRNWNTNMPNNVI